MRRRLPNAADVRAAIADARRAIDASPAPLESRVEWAPANGSCSFCGSDGEVFTAGGVAICRRTLAELVALPPGPMREAAPILDTVTRWLPPATEAALPAGEPALACSICRRSASAVPQLSVGDGVALCSDCAWHASLGRIDPATVDEIAAFEIEQARAEIADLERIRREVRNDAGIRQNPSAGLSLVRLSTIPDAETLRRLAILVRELDQGE